MSAATAVTGVASVVLNVVLNVAENVAVSAAEIAAAVIAAAKAAARTATAVAVATVPTPHPSSTHWRQRARRHPSAMTVRHAAGKAHARSARRGRTKLLMAARRPSRLSPTAHKAPTACRPKAKHAMAADAVGVVAATAATAAPKKACRKRALANNPPAAKARVAAQPLRQPFRTPRARRSKAASANAAEAVAAAVGATVSVTARASPAKAVTRANRRRR